MSGQIPGPAMQDRAWKDKKIAELDLKQVRKELQEVDRDLRRVRSELKRCTVNDPEQA